MDTNDDNLTKEERERRDKEKKEAEEAEQAALPYRWTQELGDVDITVPVPKGTRARDLSIVIAKKRLSVGLKGKDPIMSGELCKEIKMEDSTWTLGKPNALVNTSSDLTSHPLEDQQVVLIHLEKLNQQTWWENILTHHPKIDTTKIEPANSKLSDLDGETRGMVEKMMFDNQQKQMGKPTSDEIKKMEALKRFQESHPELDFSNAKIG